MEASNRTPTHGVIAYHCERCVNDRAMTVQRDGFPVCIQCDDICSRIRLCDQCGTNEAAHNEEFCVGCFTEFAIRDPNSIRKLLPSVQTEVAIRLANRLRPKLTVRQAA
jgi:uncharacterized paraquat-inducible protein A